MSILLRKSEHSDIPFLREMLYESVFWRAIANNLSFEKGLADPEVGKALANWGKRDGDIAVVALVNSNPAGAAWYRFYNNDNFIRGYIDESTPVLVNESNGIKR